MSTELLTTAHGFTVDYTDRSAPVEVAHWRSDARQDHRLGWLDVAALSVTSLAAFTCPAVSASTSATITIGRDVAIVVHRVLPLGRWMLVDSSDDLDTPSAAPIAHMTSEVLASARYAAEMASRVTFVKMPSSED
jgi:hypothetical protein